MPTEIKLNEEKNQYERNGEALVRVSTVLKEFGFIKGFGTDEDLARGHAVHLAVNLIEKGTLDWDSLDPLIQSRVDAYMIFKKETGFSAISTEQRVAHSLFKYAGQVDLFGRFPSSDELVLIDIKTGPIPKSIKLQTAAYLSALRDENVDLIAKRICRYGLHLKQNGSYSMGESMRDRSDENVFNGLAAAWWYKFNNNLLANRD